MAIFFRIILSVSFGRTLSELQRGNQWGYLLVALVLGVQCLVFSKLWIIFLFQIGHLRAFELRLCQNSRFILSFSCAFYFFNSLNTFETSSVLKRSFRIECSWPVSIECCRSFLILLALFLSILILEYRIKIEDMACGFTNSDQFETNLPSNPCSNFHAFLLFFVSRDYRVSLPLFFSSIQGRLWKFSCFNNRVLSVLCIEIFGFLILPRTV